MTVDGGEIAGIDMFLVMSQQKHDPTTIIVYPVCHSTVDPTRWV